VECVLALWQQAQRGAPDFLALIAAIGMLAGFLTIATAEVRFGLGSRLASASSKP
jgi:hypothetical protein